MSLISASACFIRQWIQHLRCQLQRPVQCGRWLWWIFLAGLSWCWLSGLSFKLPEMMAAVLFFPLWMTSSWQIGMERVYLLPRNPLLEGYDPGRMGSNAEWLPKIFVALSSWTCWPMSGHNILLDNFHSSSVWNVEHPHASDWPSKRNLIRSLDSWTNQLKREGNEMTPSKCLRTNMAVRHAW